MDGVLDKLNWQADHFTLGDLVFRLEDFKEESWTRGDECFRFFKTHRLVTQYRQLWESRSAFKPSKIMELGMFDGGSVAFWFEHFQPDMIVGVDITQRTDSDYFKRYLARGDRAQRIKTYWGTNQADRPRLLQIARDLGTLDLVIDDASHQFGPSKVSFETLFPLLRPRGLCIIEDWSWAYWPRLKEGLFPEGSEMPKLISLISDLTGSMSPYIIGKGNEHRLEPLVSNMTVYPDFVVVERGPAKVTELSLDNIPRSPQLTRALQRKKRWW